MGRYQSFYEAMWTWFYFSPISWKQFSLFIAISSRIKLAISASIHIKLLKLYELGVNRNSSETWLNEMLKIVFFCDFTDPSLECNSDSQFKIQ